MVDEHAFFVASQKLRGFQQDLEKASEEREELRAQVIDALNNSDQTGPVDYLAFAQRILEAESKMDCARRSLDETKEQLEKMLKNLIR